MKLHGIRGAGGSGLFGLLKADNGVKLAGPDPSTTKGLRTALAQL